MLAVGLMSGTSLDGIDAVLCEIEGSSLDTKIKELAFCTLDIPQKVKDKIKRCCGNEADVATVCSLNFELGELFAKAVFKVCEMQKVDTSSLAFVASHGQTIYHQPKADALHVASTLQIGEGAVIAMRCGCKVINNFRVKDMAANGEGAPLVPFSEYILYRNAQQAVALQNIGGIGNVTIIPAGANIDDVYAFDTGPGNMMIDEAMQLLYGKNYDQDGQVAASGTLNEELCNYLAQHPYLKQQPPKTTGREMFGAFLVKEILDKFANVPKADIVASLTWFTAYSIAVNYRLFVLPKHDLKEVILGGGGAHNQTLIKMLQKELPTIKILTQEDKGYSSDAKEAIAFVILGNETLHQQFSNVPSATGATQKVILGSLVYPN
ncbi:MAG: anhydro-N-acetylmuramic acid kinase AnmK [Erysipelotrichaceae bacterium]|nr:anhydro-N-acetylmuramic acid kinase AnmK [Erysipelotrichaceae bacterium]MDY5252617.1 anhydro-N-acetylmuramic acid kinase AnmK [Erysipelotrichaceae bacterium]